MHILRPSPRLNVLSIVQLLQNIDDYNHVLTLEPYLYCNYTLETHKKWCTDRLFSRWPERFPDLIRFLERNYEREPFFMPGSTKEDFTICCCIMVKKIKGHKKKLYLICILFSLLT